MTDCRLPATVAWRLDDYRFAQRLRRQGPWKLPAIVYEAVPDARQVGVPFHCGAEQSVQFRPCDILWFVLQGSA
jgi:hypothetical protein